MALDKAMLALLVVFLAASVQALEIESDYPNNELPGFVIPDLEDDDEVEDRADDEPLCLPDKWQGNITGQTSSGGKKGANSGSGKKSSILIVVDQTNKKIATKGTGGRYHNETVGTIVEFKGNDTATLYLIKYSSAKCWTKTLNHAEFRKQCIPVNATLSGEFSLGPATGGLKVQAWDFCGRTPKGHHGIVGYIRGRIMCVATPPTCIPVLVQDRGFVRRGPRTESETNEIEMDESEESSSSELESDKHRRRPKHRGRGKGFAVSMYFSEVVPDIKEVDPFTPPSYCKTAAELNEDENPIPEVLERFISF